MALYDRNFNVRWRRCFGLPGRRQGVSGSDLRLLANADAARRRSIAFAWSDVGSIIVAGAFSVTGIRCNVAGVSVACIGAITGTARNRADV
jgi:hypothetical protein